MWTPKRVLLLASVFALLIVTYAVYAHFLPIDGLPHLPDKFLPGEKGSGIEPPTHADRKDALAEKLKQAFGDACKEATTKYPIKFQLPARHMVMAAGDFKFEDDGRVRLTPVSVALFGKPEPGKSFPEINTLRAEFAYLTFDKKISNAADMASRKVTEAELRGGPGRPIEITNNRRTHQPDDDIIIQINDGPVFFRESEHRLWTDKWVTLTDWLDSAQPNKASGEGMDVYLATKQEPPPRPGQRPPKKQTNSSVSGVERIVLRSSVSMTFYVAPGSSLLSPGKDSGDLPVKQGPEKDSSPLAPKDRVTITTPGAFHYDLTKDFAQFDVPAVDPKHVRNFPEIVHVERQNLAHMLLPAVFPPAEGRAVAINPHLSLPVGAIVGPASPGAASLSAATQLLLRAAAAPRPPKPDYVRDFLDCEHLQLQFHRKTENPQQPHDDRTPALEIETVHATGSKVVLVSEGDLLEAWGTELFHNALTRQSTFKGDPKIFPNPVRVGDRVYGMWAIKEGNEIYGHELVLKNQSGAQQAEAHGPGCVFLLDKATGKRSLQASWNDHFSWTTDGPQETLTLVGNGMFYDDEHGQYLRADTLKVALLPADAKPAPNGPAASVQNSRKPKRVEANGHVVAKSPQMYVHDTESLLIHFKDVAKIDTAGPAQPPPQPSTTVSLPVKPNAIAPPKPPAPSQPTPDSPPNPIDLSAQSVEAAVLRAGDKNELDELRCIKAVRVIQKPATPDDNGVDIIGDKLYLRHFPDGNQLVVTGDLAQLRLNKIFIVGPEVNIDQVANKAWVNGIGAMQIENDSDFEGKKLARPVPLTIHWNKRMMFNGPDAEFHGGIQATQESGRLMCQTLQVYLDRPVSLKEGNKDKEPARVKNLMCDQKVSLHDVTMDGQNLLKDERLEGTYLAADNVANEARAGGPGIVRLFQPGATDLTAKPVPGKPVEMKLTYISYATRMWADNKNKVARFYDDVKLLHMPANNPNVKIDLNKVVDNLPADAMYLECKTLHVSNKQVDGKDNQELMADGGVFIKAQEFYGRAERVTYVESKDQVIFDGRSGLATLYRVRVKGAAPDKIEAKKIIYLRKTGEFSVDEGKTFQGRN